ncbi:MAG: hypothetical protein ABI885_16005 [Gammaproteobacteria bacterium]
MSEGSSVHAARTLLEDKSALAFRVSPALASASGDEPTLILVPAAPGSDEALLQTIREAGWGGETISLLPPRAIFFGIEHRGFCWFHMAEREAIEPTSFGDSLWQLERFVLDRLQEAPSTKALVLIGVDDGAALVQAAIPYLHDRIAAAIAINGYLPSASWWAPPRVDLRGLPVLLIRGARVEVENALGEALRTWHGLNRAEASRSEPQ